MFGALLTDLPKAFDCFPHDIIIAKLNACGFDMKAFNFIYDYLKNRKQRTKIDNLIAPSKQTIWSSSRINFGFFII